MSANGPSWSPDGGSFWRKDGKLYWEDGDITEDGGMMREMPTMTPESEWHKFEDFSAWTDEHRSKVKAEKAAERAAAKKAHDEWVAGIRALQESAKAKLTPEEYEAVQMEEYRL